MILAGDIGGTKTRLAVFDKNMRCVRQEKYLSRQYPDLESILRHFSAQNIKKACFGIAGPVRDGIVHATNLPWIIDLNTIKKELNIDRAWLINDLEANAHGLKGLSENQIFSLQEGDPQSVGNRALISAGTGLGEAGLYWDGDKHHPFATEGGHVDFAPRDEKELELWIYFYKQFRHISYERLLSGSGLYHIYRFLAERSGKTNLDLCEGIEECDPAQVVAQRGLKKEDKLCVEALDIFVSIYGAEAGNLALKYLSYGGLYVGGGIAPKILEVLKGGKFIESFLSKGRFSSLLKTIPVRIVLEENTALMGAAIYADEK